MAVARLGTAPLYLDFGPMPSGAYSSGSPGNEQIALSEDPVFTKQNITCNLLDSRTPLGRGKRNAFQGDFRSRCPID